MAGLRKLVVGLGNPGPKYRNTRHNVGFEVLEELSRRHGEGGARSKFDAELQEASAGGNRFLLMSPLTYMNLSGKSVLPARDFFKLELDQILVICDDLNLPLAKLRFRPSGSAGGRRGWLTSSADSVRRKFPRLRMGIGATPEGWDTAGFVLGKFSTEERALVDAAVLRAADAVADWVAHDTAFCMNRYNGG